jgi:hypothetical protein
VTPPHALVFTYVDPEGAPRVLLADDGRLVATTLDSLAAVFAGRLSERGLPVAVIPATPKQIGEVLLSGGADPDDVPERMFLIEAQTVSAEDAVRWTTELADRVPLVPLEDAA